MLVGFECDEAQGYYYSYPIPAHEIAQLFRKSPLSCRLLSLDIRINIAETEQAHAVPRPPCKGHNLTWEQKPGQNWCTQGLG